MRAPLLCGLSRQAAAPSRTNALSRTSVRRRPGNQALNCFIPSDIELFRLVSNLRRDPDEQKYAQAEELSRDRCDNCSERTIGGGLRLADPAKRPRYVLNRYQFLDSQGDSRSLPNHPPFSQTLVCAQESVMHCLCIVPGRLGGLSLGLKRGTLKIQGLAIPGGSLSSYGLSLFSSWIRWFGQIPAPSGSGFGCWSPAPAGRHRGKPVSIRRSRHPDSENSSTSWRPD